MTTVFNRKSMTERRQMLRRNMTQPEIILWSKIRRKQLYGFRIRRQYSVNEYVLDFYCPELKVAIEIDGENHNRTEMKEYDLKREEIIKSFEISIIRFTNIEINDHIENVIKRIRDALKLNNPDIVYAFPLVKGKIQKGLDNTVKM